MTELEKISLFFVVFLSYLERMLNLRKPVSAGYLISKHAYSTI